MSALKKVSSIKVNDDIEYVTSMVSIDDKIIMAAKIGPDFRGLFFGSYNIYVFSQVSDPRYLLGRYRDIPDMTKVESNSFAFIDRGSWFNSRITVEKVEFEEESTRFYRTSSFETDTNCSGITFFDNHFFLTYSGKPGFIKMLNRNGNEKSRFCVDLSGTHLFSSTISKIGISNDHKLYVSDVGQNQLSVFKLNLTLTGVDNRPSLEAEYNRMAANSIIQKGNNEFLLAIGGSENEIILLSTEGPKKIVRGHEITGVPTALCIVDEVLYVATQIKGWFSTSTRIFGFKDKDNVRPENHLISM